MLQPLIGYAIFLSKQPSLIRNFSDKVEMETTRELIIFRYYPQVTIIDSPSQKYQKSPSTLKNKKEIKSVKVKLNYLNIKVCNLKYCNC